jgi:hypothetical protein
MWSSPHHSRTPVASGPSDYLTFIPIVGALQSCRNFSNSRSLYPLEGCSNSEKSLIGTFSSAQQMPMGKRLQTRPFKGQTMPCPSGSDLYCSYKAISLRTRSSTGGWVENSLRSMPPDKGLTIYIWADAGLISIGCCWL